MSILTNYDNVPANYIPNNINSNGGESIELQMSPPFVLNGGWWWHLGEQFSFTFIPKKEYYVEEDAIITEGAAPTVPGYLGQKAYDTVNLISYKCVAGYNGTNNMWEAQSAFLIPVNGTKKIYRNIMHGGQLMALVVFNVYNFRGELIKTVNYNYANSLTINIDDEMATLLQRGTYKFEFVLVDNGDTTVIKQISVEIQ